MRARFALVVAGVALLEGALCGTVRPAGERLRSYVDLLALEGLLLALAGSFLAADRPFLAARAVARRVRRRDGSKEPAGLPGGKPPPPGSMRRRDRSFGILAMVLGVALFGAAALLWTLRPGSPPGTG